MPVIEVTHPLVRHKVGLLREASLSTKSFREITAELGRLLTYEATADFPLESVPVQCWSGPIQVDRISGKKVTVVPILRAGLGIGKDRLGYASFLCGGHEASSPPVVVNLS